MKPQKRESFYLCYPNKPDTNPPRILKYSYPDLTNIMINYLFEVARAVERNNQLAISANGLLLPHEHNLEYTLDVGSVKLLQSEQHDMTCDICGKTFPGDKGVFVKLLDHKINLSCLAHKVFAHNAMLPPIFMEQAITHFLIGVQFVRPMTDWSKDEMITEIKRLQRIVESTKEPPRSAAEEVAKVNPLAETAESKVFNLASMSATGNEIVEATDDTDDEDDSEEAELVEVTDSDSDDDDDDEED